MFYITMTRYNDNNQTEENFGLEFKTNSIHELNKYIKTHLGSDKVCKEKFLKDISKEGYALKGKPFGLNVDIYPHKFSKGIVDEYTAYYDNQKRFNLRSDAKSVKLDEYEEWKHFAFRKNL